MFREWAEGKDIDDHLDFYEYKAFVRLLGMADKNLRFLSIYIGQTLVGFTLYEILSDRYAISHFAKADKKSHASIYDLLNWEEAKYLHTQGVKFFNWEQDLGMPGLRYSKIKYKPAFFLKKILVIPKG